MTIDWQASRARSETVAHAWRRSVAVQAIAARFADPAAALETVLASAVALLGDDRWIGELLAPLNAALAADPWFDPPFRVHRAAGRIGAALIDTPSVRIGATILSAGALATPATAVIVPGHVAATRYVRAGGARLRHWRVEPAGDDFTAAGAAPATETAPSRPCDGDVVVHDGRTAGHLVTAADRDVATLTVTLRVGAAPLARAYHIADGALAHVASTDDADSRGGMLRTLLRVAGRRDAGALIGAATAAPAFHSRWSAMREWLALDAAAALPRLAEMAERDPHPEVRGAAAATLATARQRLAACPA